MAENNMSNNDKKRAGVIYFDTEQKFDSSRLVEIAIHAFPKIYNIDMNPTSADKEIDGLLNSFKVRIIYIYVYLLTYLLTYLHT